LVEVAKFYTNIDSALIFVDKDRFGDPWCIFNGVNKIGFTQLVDFGFNSHCFGGMKGSLLLQNKWNIEPCFDTMFNNGRDKTNNFGVW
jgi:hypothetical protein